MVQNSGKSCSHRRDCHVFVLRDRDRNVVRVIGCPRRRAGATIRRRLSVTTSPPHSTTSGQNGESTARQECPVSRRFAFGIGTNRGHARHPEPSELQSLGRRQLACCLCSGWPQSVRFLE